MDVSWEARPESTVRTVRGFPDCRTRPIGDPVLSSAFSGRAAVFQRLFSLERTA